MDILKNANFLVVILLSFTVNGCAFGTHTIVVSTEPAGAKLYNDGQYCGETPISVGLPWYGLIGYWDATVPIKIEKEGYQTKDTTLRRIWNNDPEKPNWHIGSEFGNGNTYYMHLDLEPQKEPKS
jgi:hypothetical protein